MGGNVFGSGTKAEKLDKIKKEYPSIKVKKFDLTNNPQVVEIGGSDLYYAKMLAEEFESVHVIDPILKEYNSEVFEGIQIYGSLFEDENF